MVAGVALRSSGALALCAPAARNLARASRTSLGLVRPPGPLPACGCGASFGKVPATPPKSSWAAPSCSPVPSRPRLLCRAASSASVAAPATDTQEGAAPAGAGGEKAVARKQRVLSGVQPTGSLHLGNYLGAIKNWVALQDTFETFFCAVDLHAITLPHDPASLAHTTKNSAALYIAAGIDPAKASIFVQSHVSAHAELTWLLSCVTPIGWLNRMIQFKEKSLKQGNEEVGSGLLTYPVLMAADILLYQSDLVPVGEDQKQHIELARDVAKRFNDQFGGNKWKKRGGRGGRIFKVPEIMTPPTGARVMSLTDGTAKMSKSDPADGSRINLLDSPSEIAKKIKRCKTDGFEGLEYGNPERPECSNLLGIYEVVTGRSKQEVLAECGSLSWGQFKPLLADAVVAHLEPIQTRYNEVVADPAYLDTVLANGAAKANETARLTLKNAYDAMGFLLPSTLR